MSDRKPAANTDDARTQQLCLTAWELAASRGDDALSPKAAGIMMRAEERLQAELERLMRIKTAQDRERARDDAIEDELAAMKRRLGLDED